MIGYNGNGRDNMVWHPDTGEYWSHSDACHTQICKAKNLTLIFLLRSGSEVRMFYDTLLCAGVFVYTSGCLVVVEDLNEGTQRHLAGLKLPIVLGATRKSEGFFAKVFSDVQ